MPDAGDTETSEMLELPLLAEGLAQLRARSGVLDFGPIQHRLLEYLQPTRSRLHVLDLESVNVGPKHWTDVLESIVNAFEHERCDWVMTWDRLNYLDASGLTLLDSALGRIGAAGMKLHALIRYARPEMPVEPDRYAMLDGDRIRRLTQTSDRMQAPRYSPKALEKYMPGFKVDRTRLLGNGMQEFLLRLDRPDDQKGAL